VVPKLLGCYEEELFPAIESAISIGYDRVIDIGCASGWYVVGMARALPAAEVFGFDTDEQSLTRCREIAELNGVSERVSLDGFCTPATLEGLITGRTVIICDIEGGEVDLLRPDLAPSLRHADLIVELHDEVGDTSISDTVLPRFEGTHDIDFLHSRNRAPSVDRYPRLEALPPSDWHDALDERRSRPMRWALMKARAAEASG
jgi:hypothetical protein